jgi:flagellar hook protein FlgE
MAINSVLQSGIQGFQSSVRGMQDTASRIAQTSISESGASTSDLAGSFIELKLYERSAEASAKVVKTADSMLGTLLDIKA